MADQTSSINPQWVAPAREDGTPVAYPREAILTTEEVAAWLRVSPRKLEGMDVPCSFLGARTRRYVAGTVLDWLERRVA